MTVLVPLPVVLPLLAMVDDAGPGVAPDEREHVFDRLARGRSARPRRAGGGPPPPAAHHGAGLGLSLVREYARLHGGTAWVESSAAGGARFVVEVPVGDAARA